MREAVIRGNSAEQVGPFRGLPDRRGHLFEAPPRAPRQDETHAFSTTFRRFQMPQEQFVGPTLFGLRVGFINEAQGVLWSGFEDVQRGAEIGRASCRERV